MPTELQSFVVLDALVNDPPPDKAERRRLANIVRDEIDEMRRTIDAAAKRGAAVAQTVHGARSGERQRTVKAWFRGSSLSFHFDLVDTAWAEDIWTTVPKLKKAPTFRLRPLDPAKAMDAFPQGRAVKCTLAINAPESDYELGDWRVSGIKTRNIGGNSGRAPILTFGFDFFAPFPPAEVPEGESHVQLVEDESPDADDGEQPPEASP